MSPRDVAIIIVVAEAPLAIVTIVALLKGYRITMTRDTKGSYEVFKGE